MRASHAALALALLLVAGCASNDSPGCPGTDLCSTTGPTDPPVIVGNNGTIVDPPQLPEVDLGTSFRVVRACMPVSLADGRSFPIVGTLMDPTSAPTALAIVLPGASGTRGMFDQSGVPADAARNLTFQRALAGQGVASWVIDRPGMGESPHEGRAVNLTQHSDVIGQLVAGARVGAWQVGDGCEPGRLFSKVVLGGHSGGWLLALDHVVRAFDVDGVILIAPMVSGGNPNVVAMLGYCGVKHHDVETGRSNLICPDVVPPMARCPDVMAHEADPAAVEAFCQQVYATPEGVAASEMPLLFATARDNVAKFKEECPPTLLVFYEFDNVANTPGQQPKEQAETAAEFECPNLDPVTIEDTGHIWLLSPGQETGYAQIAQWMLTNGFAGAAELGPEAVA